MTKFLMPSPFRLGQKLILVFVMAGLLTACNRKAGESMQNKEVDALLWEISGQGFEKPSYVYGTIHLIDAKDYFLPKGTVAAIENCRAMFFEIDVNEMTDMGAMMGLMDKIFMKDGKSLKDLLPKEDYEYVSDFFSKMGLPMILMERIKPLFLSAMAYGDISPDAFQKGEMKSYELEFNELAQDKGMETGGLETIEFQIGVFDKIPYEAQAEMLVETLKSSNTENDEMKVMTEMYKKQQISKMAQAALGEGDNSLEGFETLLLSDRNKNWIPQIISQSKKQPTFFAVGAGHLGGPEGVLALLRKEGVKVRPISNE